MHIFIFVWIIPLFSFSDVNLLLRLCDALCMLNFVLYMYIILNMYQIIYITLIEIRLIALVLCFIFSAWNISFPSSGFAAYTAVTQICRYITLFGFYPFYQDWHNRTLQHTNRAANGGKRPCYAGRISDIRRTEPNRSNTSHKMIVIINVQDYTGWPIKNGTAHFPQ